MKIPERKTSVLESLYNSTRKEMIIGDFSETFLIHLLTLQVLYGNGFIYYEQVISRFASSVTNLTRRSALLRLRFNVRTTRFQFLTNTSEVFSQNEFCSAYLMNCRNCSILRDSLKVDESFKSTSCMIQKQNSTPKQNLESLKIKLLGSIITYVESGEMNFIIILVTAIFKSYSRLKKKQTALDSYSTYSH